MAKKPVKRLRPPDWIGNALAAEQDRGCVLVGCAYVELYFDILLQKFFEKQGVAKSDEIRKVLNLDNNNSMALLGSGWAKAHISLLTGLIERDTYQLYDRLRVLRNDFAHTPGAVVLTDAAVDELVVLLNDGERSRAYSNTLTPLRMENTPFVETQRTVNRILGRGLSSWRHV